MKKHLGISAKISLGFVFLAMMLVISGALSIHELTLMGRDIRAILDDSYRSVRYSQFMLSSIENQQFALLHYIEDSRQGVHKPLTEYRISESEFRDNLRLAQSNLTHDNEGLLVDSIHRFYQIFMNATNRFMNSASPDLRLYLDSVKPYAEDVIRSVNRLLALNQKGLYNSSELLEDTPNRALRPGLIVIVIGIIFTLMFIYLIRHFYVTPVKRMGENVRAFVKFQRYKSVPMVATDELSRLRDAIDDLVKYAQHNKKES